MTFLAIPTPPSLTSLAELEDRCSAVDVWAERCESVPEAQDVLNKMAAIDEYLARTTTDGRSRLARTMRRLEVRIGVLLGEAKIGRPETSVANEVSTLTANQRHEFRQMAAHPEVVEDVIAGSTDEKPASRRSVMERIDETKRVLPPEPTSFKSQAAISARVEKAKEMADAGYTSRQIAKEIGISQAGMTGWRRRHAIEVPADGIVGKTRILDSNQIIAEAATTLEATVTALDLVELAQLDPEHIEHWVTSLGTSLRSLNRFLKQLKESAEQ